ncbi:MarR family winged helix-turn-helix transcriptional regulator [Kibdelosporangium phytohabitans]|uniref:MarR family transcriptional regulator n=1 Tax=Kibdelosporangium phytohabitans TaxID=860235 RepID=A0A0N9IG44_9PSEU|nr:MarR family transcriptional regulator [Kibdelosporangium phytohabitans]ALG15508.1 MarR family transcriptional regulator [Kibdelosporangium phytohabitans]MBE1464490.1 DNA-binding MarR family transcriptional regulator [Kibdelosporangium phytohabitans]
MTHAENPEPRPLRPHSAQGEVSEHALKILDGLRAFGADYTDITNKFAAWLGLHSTEAAALVEILHAEDSGTPLSPTQLSTRLSLTTGATTNLLNRLERLGHIVRTREHADRRKVTVRASPQIEEPAREFFEPFNTRLGDLVSRYSPEELARFEDLLDGLRSTLRSL